MIATAKPWKADPDRACSWSRTYFNTPNSARRVIADVTTDPIEGRVWFIAWRVTGGRDRWGDEIREVITRGSYALMPGAAAVAKRTASRAAAKAARTEATDYYRRALALAVERAETARAAIADLELTEYRQLAALQDQLAEAEAAMRQLGTDMLTLAA